jgi:sec-independent protein translocase protein TatB
MGVRFPTHPAPSKTQQPMFDIAFTEVIVIAVVALIVIGPERLPRVARTLGHLFGRMQRYVNDVKHDIQREIELDELRKLKQTVEESARSIEQSVAREYESARHEVRSVESLAESALSPPSPAAETPPSPSPLAAPQAEPKTEARGGGQP